MDGTEVGSSIGFESRGDVSRQSFDAIIIRHIGLWVDVLLGQ